MIGLVWRLAVAEIPPTGLLLEAGIYLDPLAARGPPARKSCTLGGPLSGRA